MSVPFVIERDDNNNEKAYDLYSRLLKDRIIFVGEAVDDGMANAIIAQLLFLESQDPEKDIYMYINSPGGSVSAGLGIYDTMQYIRPNVATVCVGAAASMGCGLLAGGAKGKRYSLPHSRIMMHPVSGGFRGTNPDIQIQAAEAKIVQQQMFELFAKDCSRSVEEVERDFQRDKFMSAKEALEYGIIDKIHEKSLRQKNE